MKEWPPKDWRALLALLFSVLGAVILTAFVWWGVHQLLPRADGWKVENEDERLQTIRWVLWVATGAIALVLIGLGMAINRRSFRGKIGGADFGFEGGEGSEPQVEAARRVERAATEERQQIEQEVAEEPATPPDTFPLPPADDDQRI